ncbi:MAG: hypothetical protein CMP93_04210 [Gammaproteobacteria bacterium]|nr:hypothetical protein [Gammaproteobacteria bacterium]|tara:strand:- start:2926 stop:3294 length:369 start_codon:yes stop_codon:yes gene_type:complete
MLLSLSGDKTGNEYNLNAVNTPSGLAGVEDEHWIRLITELTMTKEWEQLSQTREEAAQIIGEQKVVDTLVVASAFNGITRVADATGIPLDVDTEKNTAQMRTDTGIQSFNYDEKSARYNVLS